MASKKESKHFDGTGMGGPGGVPYETAVEGTVHGSDEAVEKGGISITGPNNAGGAKMPHGDKRH